jgi:hypothetical protein
MFTALRSAAEDLARVYDARELSAERAVRAMEDLAAIVNAVQGMVAQTALRVDETSAHARSGDRSSQSLLARKLGIGAGEAREKMETARKLRSLPETDKQVRAGKLSSKQAQMIADAASRNPEAEQRLLDAAEDGLAPLRDACQHAKAEVEDPVERARRQKRLRGLRMWTDTDGMVAGQFRLTPEIGAQVKARIDAEVQRIFRAKRKGSEHEPHDAYAADALAEFVLADRQASEQNREGRRRTAQQDPVEARVHILIDHGALMRGGAVEGEVCEIPGVGPVNVEWVRELIGSAFLTAVIKKGRDLLTVAHLGRHVPAELQTALLVSGRECDVAGCNHRGYLERDHAHDYAKGGLTAYWNLRWLCYVHHRLKSSGWILGPPDPTTGKCELRAPKSRAA